MTVILSQVTKDIWNFSVEFKSNFTPFGCETGGKGRKTLTMTLTVDL